MKLLTTTLRLACLYSYDCRMAKEKGVQEILLDQINIKGNFSEKEVISAIQKLQSYPAYRLIATLKSRSNVLSEDIVRAYWFGEGDPRFEFASLPNHNFATLEKIELFKKIFGIDSEKVSPLLNCSISWGEVVKLNSDKAEVFETGLVRRGGNIVLASRRKKVDLAFLDKDKIKKGDILSIHISMAREIISRNQALILEKRTLEALKRS